MIPLALTVLAATAAGFGAEHRMGERADDVAQRVVWLMLWVLGPPITFLNLAALELRAEVGAGIAFAYVALLASLAIAWALGTFVLRLPRPAVGGLMLVAAFANTGYLGLPFVAAVFGLEDLPDAVAYDVVLTTIGIFTIGFSVGAAFGTRGERPRERVMAFFAHNPVVWAALAGFLAPSALAPQAAVDVSQAAVFALLPLGFFVVGVTLASEAEEGAVRFPPPLTPAVGTALALKLLLSPAIVLGLSAVILRVPDSYLAQAAMASAINCIVVARTFGLDRGLVASAIAWSTAIVVAAGLVAALL